MPKLAPINVLYQNKGGEEIRITAEVSVSQNGVFSIIIPQDQTDDYKEALEKNKTEYSGIKITDTTKKVKNSFGTFTKQKVTVLESKDLVKCSSFFVETRKNMEKWESKKELVIIYTQENKVCYSRNKTTGEIDLPREINDFDKDFEFINTAIDEYRYSTMRVYSIGISAKVLIKETLTKNSKEKITYKYAHNYQYSEIDKHIKIEKNSYAERLNKINTYFNDNWSYDMNGIKLESGSVVIPYTEERAKFFYDMVIGICKIADKLNEFMSSEASVVKTIESNNFKLLASEK